jgi:hypothetical protein
VLAILLGSIAVAVPYGYLVAMVVGVVLFRLMERGSPRS